MPRLSQRPWSRSELKRWHGTFTADNKLGAKKLTYELRHKGAEAVAREQCAREEKRLEGVQRSAAENIRQAVKSAGQRQHSAHDPDAHLYERMQRKWDESAPGKALVSVLETVRRGWAWLACKALGHKWPKQPFKKYEVGGGGLLQWQLMQDQQGPQYEFRCSRYECEGRKPY